jgi:hypothetical protein
MLGVCNKKLIIRVYKKYQTNMSIYQSYARSTNATIYFPGIYMIHKESSTTH